MSYVKSMQIGSTEHKLLDYRFDTEEFYELSLGAISDTRIDTSQNVLLQSIVNGLASNKTYTIKYGKQILSAIPTKRTDNLGSYYTLVASKDINFTTIKIRVDDSNQVWGAIRYEVTPISYGDTVPATLYPGTVFCKLGGAVVFYSDTQFYLGIDDYHYNDDGEWTKIGNTWHGDGSLEYSTDGGKNWTQWCAAGATVTPQASALSSYGDYRLYVRGKNGTHTADNTSEDPIYSVFTSKNSDGSADVPFNVMGKFDWLLNCESNSVECGDCSCLFRSAPIVDASGLVMSKQLTEGCYFFTFYSCTSLTAAPQLPATTLADRCYIGMFTGCTSLTTAPELPATTLADRCYLNMFGSDEDSEPIIPGCTSLTTAPELPAETLTDHCYCQMFNGCSSLTTPPTLPATTLNNDCYAFIFKECTSLTTPPELPATTLAEGCYSGMFRDCISLTTAPTLPATTLAKECYHTMLYGCTSLTAPCELPALEMKDGCYAHMFEKCTGITWTTDTSATPYQIPKNGGGSEGTAAGWNTDMFLDNSGTLPGGRTPLINTTYYYVTPPEAVVFYSDTQFYLGIDEINSGMIPIPTGNHTWHGDGTLEYSTDAGKNWNTWCAAGATVTPQASALSPYGDYRLYVRGKNGTKTGDTLYSAFTSKNSDGSADVPFNVMGKFDWLLNCELNNVECGKCSYLFYSAPVVDASGLTMSKKLNAESCYMQMFINCTSLTKPPTLPATQLTANCYAGMFCNTALITAPELPATTLATNCYASMFTNCTSLTQPPTLPATTLANNCYSNMFQYCTSLTAPCELPATTMADGCYNTMFDGCTGITWTLDTSATPYRLPTTGTGTEATEWSDGMFSDNGGDRPEGSGTPQINTTYYYVTSMDKCVIFSGDSTFNLGLVGGKWYGSDTSGNPGFLEISTDKKNWATWDYTAKAAVLQSNSKYEVYIRGKGNNNTGDYDIEEMSGNASIFTTSAPVNLIGKLDWIIDYTASNPVCGNCALLFGDSTFEGTSPAQIVDASGFVMSKNLETTSGMNFAAIFAGCTSLTTPPTLPATQLAIGCYLYMFFGCTSLTTPPTLPATQLAIACYNCMFYGCKSLTTTPELPVTTLADACYSSMFAGCESLTTPPTLPATTLTLSCYSGMFAECKALITTPELPATAVSEMAYAQMFQNCTSLTTAPELPATTLAKNCYASMFRGCTALTTPPALPATTMAELCYNWMFQGCTGITWTTDTSATPYRLPSSGSGTTATQWSHQMFLDNSGTLPGSEAGGAGNGTPSIDTTYYYVTSMDKCVIFSGDSTFNLGLVGGKWYGSDTSGNPGFLEISTDKKNWATWDYTAKAAVLQSNSKYEVYIRGKGNNRTTDSDCSNISTFTISAPVNLIGKHDWIIDYTATNPVCINALNLFEGASIVDASGFVLSKNFDTTAEEEGLGWMFSGCTSLTTPPQLPATTLADCAYGSMFEDCTALKIAPELSATTLTGCCYSGMFSGCESLEIAPELPAMTLTEQCYYQMFYGCTSLTTAPTLPATQLADNCYNSMFLGCTSLTTPPELPATTLADYCYYSMFRECTSLEKPSEILATTVVDGCCNGMFQDCSGIKFSDSGTAYRIPPTGTATQGTGEWASSMFAGCSGSPLPGSERTPSAPGHPQINTTYYYQ